MRDKAAVAERITGSVSSKQYGYEDLLAPIIAGGCWAALRRLVGAGPRFGGWLAGAGCPAAAAASCCPTHSLCAPRCPALHCPQRRAST